MKKYKKSNFTKNSKDAIEIYKSEYWGIEEYSSLAELGVLMELDEYTRNPNCYKDNENSYNEKEKNNYNDIELPF